MAYSIYIEKEEPITLTDWSNAVGSIECLKIDSSDIEGRNPTTGEVMKIKGAEGDVSIYDEDAKMWCKIMSFSEGSICFKAPRDWDSIPVSPLRKAAVLLAVALGARVVGEEGEEYK